MKKFLALALVLCLAGCQHVQKTEKAPANTKPTTTTEQPAGEVVDLKPVTPKCKGGVCK